MEYFVALFAGHWLGDHWIQTNPQAATKGACSWAGRCACAGHVATLTAVQALMLAAVGAVTGHWPDPLLVVLALGVNAISHYWCDRRTTLEGLAYALHRTGKHEYYKVGSAQLDQAFHMFYLVPASLILTAPSLIVGAVVAAAALAVLVLIDLVARYGRRIKPAVDAADAAAKAAAARKAAAAAQG